MKIRTDYVTNSSSSSFIIINVKNPVLSKIIEKAKEYLEENLDAYVDNIGEDEWTINIEEIWIETPTSKKDIIRILVTLFSYDEIYFDEDEEGFDIEEILNELEDHEIALEIFNKRKEILDAMEYIEINNTDLGWQGDDDSRYYEDNYDEETLKDMYETIAEINGVEVSEVDEDMFAEYVSDKMSASETIFKYDKKTDEVKITHSFTLE